MTKAAFSAEKYYGSLEALLFLYGEPMSFKKIASTLDISLQECEALVQSFEEVLAGREDRGLRVVRHQDKVQLVTKPAFRDFLSQFVKAEMSEDLTPAALETLSVILYLGPVARSRIEYIRGVNSMFTLRSLLLRGLIERAPDPERPHSFIYTVSFDTLKHLGLTKPAEAPEFQKFQEVLSGLETQPT